MSYIKPFKKFKSLLNEGIDPLTVIPKLISEAIVPNKDAKKNQISKSLVLPNFENFKVPQDVLDLETVQTFFSDFKKANIPTRSSTGGSKYDDIASIMSLFYQGQWRRSKFAPGREYSDDDKEFFKTRKDADGDIMWKYIKKGEYGAESLWLLFMDYVLEKKGLKPKLVKGESVKVYINDKGNVYTIGDLRRPTEGTKVINSTEPSSEDYDWCVEYLNDWNLINTANGYKFQYTFPNGLVDQENNKAGKQGRYLSFTKISRKSVGNLKPILYGTSKETYAKIKEVSKGGNTETTGASAGGNGIIEIAYNNMEFLKDNGGVKVDQNHPKVKAEAQKILGLLTGDEYVKDMTIVSSASPPYNTMKKMADYAGKTTSGNSDPGAGTDDASKNAKLAYDRGNTLAMALKAALGDRIGNLTVNWKISEEGAGGGKNSTYTWTKESNPGKTFTTPVKNVSSGGEKQSNSGEYGAKMFTYTISSGSPF